MTSRAGLASPARVTSPASRRDRAHRLGAWGKALRTRGVHDSPSGRMRPRKESSPQLIDRPSRESRGASVLETARACSDGGFSGNHRCSCDEQSSLVSPVLGRDGSGRHGFGCWVARVSAGALQPESDSECPLSLQHAVAGALRKERLRAQRASFFRGLAPLAGKGRASARATTGDGCSTSVERPEPLGSGLSLVACHRRLSRAKARDCPGFGTTWQGVSRAGRVRDCVVRARVLIVKTDSRGAHRALRRASFGNEEVSSAARRRREATSGPLPKVKSASGPRGTGSQTNRSPDPP
jgi:hypothetical protein